MAYRAGDARSERRSGEAGPAHPEQRQYFRDAVEPHGDVHRAGYVGEVAAIAKQQLGANAQALLMPVCWREPFRVVMIEASGAGTPVIAFGDGVAAEIVIYGENGMLVSDEHQMARAPDQIGAIDPARCRASVAGRHDVAVTTTGYKRLYRPVADVGRAPAALAAHAQRQAQWVTT